MSLLKELRHAARGLKGSPVFTGAALITLAFAIGANTAIFSLVDALLIEPLPFREPDRLVQTLYLDPTDKRTEPSPMVTGGHFLDWRRESRVFSGLAAHTDAVGSSLTGDGPPDRVSGARVTHDLFAILGVEPELGRVFTAAEDRPGGPRVALLSHDLWHRRFGADPAILGREIELDGEATAVVGVMPPELRYPPGAELWRPLALDPADESLVSFLSTVGRMKEGIGLADVRTDLLRVDRETITGVYLRGAGPLPRLLEEQLYGEQKPLLAALAGAVAAVLAIACVNLANLQLARAAGRQRELAIRAALGAGPARVARLALVESVLLAVAGGAAGIAVAYGGLPALAALLPEEVVALAAPLRIDGTVLAFTLALSVATGLAFGLAPAALAWRPRLLAPLSGGAALATARAGGFRLRWLLIVSEVALAQVVLAAALLLARSFVGLLGAGLGFDPAPLLTLRLSPSPADLGEVAALDRLAREVVARVERVSGVAAAGIVAPMPLGMGSDVEVAAELPFVVDGIYRDGAVPGDPGVGRVEHRAVTPGLLEALGVRLVAGRSLTAADARPGAPLVAVVNRRVAAAGWWPGGTPLGQGLLIGLPLAPELADPVPREVVGVVEDVREFGLERRTPEIAYVPLAQVPQSLAALILELLPVHLVVRVEEGVAPGEVADAVREAVWSVDPRQPITEVRPMREVVGAALAGRRAQALLMGLLALVALILATVGIYGVVSHLVGQRTREIGIRMAFGATSRRVLWALVQQGAPAILAGLMLGSAGSFAAARALAASGMLHGVRAGDPTGLALAPALLAAVALAALTLPVRRASRLPPMVALEDERA